MGTCGVGSRCAYTECEKYGTEQSPPQKTGGASQDPCSVKNKYGNNVTGHYNIKFYGPAGNVIVTEVNCAHSMCSPVKPDQNKNACYQICGKSACGYDNARKI